MVFEGKKAVIVGGLGGIGYATAKSLLQNGASVCTYESHRKTLIDLTIILIERR